MAWLWYSFIHMPRTSKSFTHRQIFWSCSGLRVLNLLLFYCIRYKHIHTHRVRVIPATRTKKNCYEMLICIKFWMCVQTNVHFFCAEIDIFFCLNNLYLFTWKFMECRQTNGRFFRTVIILYHFFVRSILVVVLIV